MRRAGSSVLGPVTLVAALAATMLVAAVPPVSWSGPAGAATPETGTSSPATTASVPISVRQDPTLEALLLNEPIPGWTQASDPSLGSMLHGMSLGIDAITLQSGTVAGRLWTSPTGTGSLLIALLAFPRAVSPQPAAHEMAMAGCGATTGQYHQPLAPATTLLGGVSAPCVGTFHGAGGGMVVAWPHQNALGLVVSFGIPASTTAAVATRQAGAFPADAIVDPELPGSSATASTGGSAGSSGWIFVLVAAVVVAILLGLLAWLRRGHRPAEPHVGARHANADTDTSPEDRTPTTTPRRPTP